ncbi:Phenolic glucoside malonyltransferase 1 [Cardamine amara subsp. amara]|uniref:Phenolic glucoside malonyltransferase 1 n=1 Tax=Cardamine amara subsp. amara TaxID=228776 RepID=A0ABD1AF38_CARAN
MNPSLNIIHVSRVTPSTPNSSESLTLPLTFFDLLWLKHKAVERVIFYQLTESTRSYFDSVIVPNLKSSLSLTLSHYLPLAGQLKWDPLDPKPSIIYSPNDAVCFTVAESNADFSQLSGNEPFSSTELYPLVPELQVSDDSASIVSFQVTLFPNEGFSIGVTTHHAVSDGKTTTTFLKSWAHVCKQQDCSLPDDLIPFYDRTVIKGPSEIDTKVLKIWYSIDDDKPKSLKLLPKPEIDSDVVRFTFEFTRENIETLRDRLKRESSFSSIRLSTFVITFSYVFTCLIRSGSDDPNRSVGYRFAVDCRRLIDPPIPLTYFGNCVFSAVKIPLMAGMFLGEDGFVKAAKLITGSVKELDSNVAWKIPELLETYENVPVESQFVSVAGSTRFGVYRLDFGWGKPVKVLIVSIDQRGKISMAESKDGNGGVEVGFSLKKREMNVLIDLLHKGIN